jgi:hypothetical protein
VSGRSRFGSAAVVIDFTAGKAEGSFIGLDAIAQFERVMGTGQDDTLIGDSANNILLGFGVPTTSKAETATTSYSARTESTFSTAGLAPMTVWVRPS